MSKMELNDDQKLQVAAWIADGLGLSELQKRLKSDLDLTLTYMDVRCLVDDLSLVSRDLEVEEKEEDAASPPTPAPGPPRDPDRKRTPLAIVDKNADRASLGSGSQYQTPQVEAELKRQRAAATVSSLVIALLTVGLVGVILALILLPSFFTKSPTLVTYDDSRIDEEQFDHREVNTQVQRQPSAPSSAMAKVLASTAPSPIAVPVPELTHDPSLAFGDGDDFGVGWGSGDGFGAGGTSFFGQAVRAERIAYVIDFSSSMGSEGRADLMRRELTKSLGNITHGTRYGVIFFSCIAWEAGDHVNLDRKRGHAVVRGEDGRPFEWKDLGGKQGWKQAGIPQRADWLIASQNQLARSKKIVKGAPLSSGTAWDKGLNMALDMTPLPQVVYFMTDGVASGSGAWARELGGKARSKGVRINCIALMEPRAHDDMNELAKLTGGQFTIVTKGGKHKRVR
ncbi:MAG: vWA domain-containing protein [Roseibacillus sp.]